MKRKKTTRYALIAVGVLIIIVIVARQAGWIEKKNAIKVTVEKVERRNIIEIVNSSGKIQPVTEVKISPDVSGEIIEILMEEGDFVEKGDLLVRINPDIYESALDRVEASLNTSRANLANSKARKAQAEAQFINAEASFKRNEKLFEQDAISQSEFDAARSQFLVAKSEVEAAGQSVVGATFQVKSAEASLKEAQENLTKTNIFAPMNGTISRLDAEPGERVVGTSQFAGTEIFRIANLNQMEVVVDVNENDIIRVNEGDTAYIEIDAWRNEIFKGLVTSIANSALNEEMAVDQVTNFEVKIRILQSSYQHLLDPEKPHLSPFRPGMSASANIRTQARNNVLSVPIQSVTTRDADPQNDTIQTQNGQNDRTNVNNENLQEFVFVYNESDQTVTLKNVESGIQDTNYIEIEDGLSTDDKIVTGPFRAVSRTLNDGDLVEVVERNKLFTE
ncbi:MAG: efflux RND transporter periplasmic adaptor subunit [Bacteroidota bacterium]